MKSETKQFSIRVVFLCVVFLLSLLGFYWIVDEAVVEKQTGFDEAVINFRIKYASAELINLMETITFFGSPKFLLPSYLVIVIYFLFKKKYRFALIILLTGIITTVLMFSLKRIFQRNRPHEQLIERLTNYSFPSGHAFSSFIFCSIVSYLVWKTSLRTGLKWLLMVLLMLFSLSIGLSRVVLNVHFATDVIAGFCLGLMWVTLFFLLFRKYL